MGKRPLTSRQLAKLIGVSQSTVSRTFSNEGTVSPETRKMVIEAARELGYRPNAIARILSKHTSDIVGVVTADIHSPFYLEILDRLSRRMQNVGLHPLLFNLPAGADGANQLDVLRQYNIRNVIVISGRISDIAVAKWAEDGRSVILVNREMPDVAVSGVQSDSVNSSRAVADYFYAAGLKRVAYVGGPTGTPTSSMRERAFTQRVAELGMTLSKIGGGREYSHEAGFAAAKDVWKTTPDAIFFASDRLAIGGLFALRHDLSVRVPQDVSLVGFDDIDMSRWSGIDLSTVRQDADRITGATMELLSAAIGSDAGQYRNISVPCELVLRKTTPPPPT